MSNTARVVNLLAVVAPPILIAVSIVVFWNDVVGVHDLALLAAMYVITGYGVTVGFHRMLTHRSFRTSKPVEYLFAAAGSMAVQGPVINWVADHRNHHAHTDEEGHPLRPRPRRGPGHADHQPLLPRPRRAGPRAPVRRGVAAPRRAQRRAHRPAL